MKFIIYSNIFFLIPVIAALWVNEWVYAAIGFSACIFSPMYHYLRVYHSKHITLANIFRNLDWLSGIACYGYMYYFLFAKVNPQFLASLFVALSLTLLFFFYGFRFGNYKKGHPWFHVILPVVSAFIVLSK